MVRASDFHKRDRSTRSKVDGEKMRRFIAALESEKKAPANFPPEGFIHTKRKERNQSQADQNKKPAQANGLDGQD
jgi:hypothetical protein